jgi:hypothetical protein
VLGAGKGLAFYILDIIPTSFGTNTNFGCVDLNPLIDLYYYWLQKVMSRFAWYLDITLNEMFSFDEYPIAGKRGLPRCQEHGRQLEKKEVVVLDQ